MLLAIVDEGIFSMYYTWPSTANHSSKKDEFPMKLKNALISVGRITLKAQNQRMTMTEYTTALRNLFSGNKVRVSTLRQLYCILWSRLMPFSTRSTSAR